MSFGCGDLAGFQQVFLFLTPGMEDRDLSRVWGEGLGVGKGHLEVFSGRSLIPQQVVDKLTGKIIFHSIKQGDFFSLDSLTSKGRDDSERRGSHGAFFELWSEVRTPVQMGVLF